MINIVNLKEARLTNGYIQKALAKAIGIKEGTYRKIELGKMQPSIEVFAKLVKVLNLQKADIEDLIIIK